MTNEGFDYLLMRSSALAIFCTEPFRIPFAGRVDVCCFDKTGTITAENLVLEGIVGVEYVFHGLTVCSNHGSDLPCSPTDPKRLVDVKESSRETTLCLAGAHALVQLDDGVTVGDPMEKTTLEALDWAIAKDKVAPKTATAPHRTTLSIRKRFPLLFRAQAHVHRLRPSEQPHSSLSKRRPGDDQDYAFGRTGEL